MNDQKRLDSEKFVNDSLASMRKDNRITNVHRIALAMGLLLSVGINPKFQLAEFKMLRVGRLVHVKCQHAKRACSFPEEGHLVGMLVHVNGTRCMVRVRADCIICVDSSVLTEVK